MRINALFINECESCDMLTRSDEICVDSNCVITLIDNGVITSLIMIMKIKNSCVLLDVFEMIEKHVFMSSSRKMVDPMFTN